MSIFGKKSPAIVVCPICTARFDAPDKAAHWASHVTQVPEGEDPSGDQFTWTCVCGPTSMVWPDAESAAAGMALHMQHRHNIEP